MRSLPLATVLLASCYGQTTYVDSRFSADDVANIKAAASMWEAEGVESFDLVFGAKVDVRENKRAIVRVNSWTAASSLLDLIEPANVALTVRRPFAPPVVWMFPDRLAANGCPFLGTVAHELGHVLGLEDIEADGAIMDRQCTSVSELQPADRRELLRVVPCAYEPGGCAR